MATNLALDNELIIQALTVGHHKTKREAVTAALKEYIAHKKQFKQLKNLLSFFEDIPLKTEHFEKAAEFSNICRSKGIQGSTIDFLICAVAYIENLIIFTTDKDFENYKKYLSIQLIK